MRLALELLIILIGAAGAIVTINHNPPPTITIIEAR